jgi:hypothetical protein
MSGEIDHIEQPYADPTLVWLQATANLEDWEALPTARPLT